MEQEYVLLIRRHRFYILICMLLGIGIGVGCNFLLNNMYEAKTKIYVSSKTEVGFPGEDGASIDQGSSFDTYAMQQMLLNSNEMTVLLIRKFNLYRHYKIDSTSEYAFERVIKKLNNRLEFKNNAGLNLYEITFSDPNERFAINFVNFVASKLQDLNKNLVVERLKEKAQFYRLILKNVNAESATISKQLTTQIEKFKGIMKEYKMDPNQYENMLNFQNSLMSLTADLKGVNQKLNSANNLYQLAMVNISDNSYPIVRQIEKAIPRERVIWHLHLLFGLVGMVGLMILYLFILYIIVRYKTELSIIFYGKQT